MNQAYGQILDLNPGRENLTPKYRRNGKLQSCEPCRKSKLRCDHVLPACGRCAKRRRIEQCVYHPSPLTQSHQTPAAALPTPSTESLESPPTVYKSIDQPSPVVEAATPIPSVSEAPLAVPRCASAPPLENRRDSTVGGHPGFLGSTSYSSIFAEDLGRLGVVSADLEARPVRTISIPNDRIVRGCQVLSFLKDRLLVNRFVHRWYELSEGCGIIAIESIMKGWLNRMWLIHGDILREQKPDKIRRLSELIWQNTQSPLVFDGTISPSQWMSLGTGQNIRWEVIGMIAAIVGMCANTLEASDHLFKEHKVSRAKLPKQMSEIAEACLSFCRECEALDDMFIWLLMENYPLTAALKGEGSYSAYATCGELLNAVVTKGLHQGVQVDGRTPFFLADLRKRAFIQTYGADISLASFLGRPPRLSYRYCKLDLPLDLNDTEIVMEGEQLQAAIASLDSNGWNTADNMSRTTWMRAWLSIAPRREDILDISLGDYTREEVIRRADEIQEKAEKQWKSLPPFLQRARKEPSFLKTKPLDTLYKNVIRQGFLSNELLLQRVLIRKTGSSSDKLIDTARQIFKDIMLIVTRHDIAKHFQMDVMYLLAAHGLRSAAIIAVELLKQEQLPTYPTNPLLPRSETIQDLSIFAARLGAVEPSDGTFAICDQGRKVITRILDKILAPPQGSAGIENQGRVQSERMQGSLDVMMGATYDVELGLEAPLNLGNDSDFMLWLENMDWEKQGPWGAFQ